MLRSVNPLVNGTKGKMRNELIGNAPFAALEDESNHAVEHKLANVNALKSFCVSISSSCDGNIAETVTVNSCKIAIVGQTKKTNGAGVT